MGSETEEEMYSFALVFFTNTKEVSVIKLSSVKHLKSYKLNEEYDFENWNTHTKIIVRWVHTKSCGRFKKGEVEECVARILQFGTDEDYDGMEKISSKYKKGKIELADVSIIYQEQMGHGHRPLVENSKYSSDTFKLCKARKASKADRLSAKSTKPTNSGSSQHVSSSPKLNGITPLDNEGDYSEKDKRIRQLKMALEMEKKEKAKALKELAKLKPLSDLVQVTSDLQLIAERLCSRSKFDCVNDISQKQKDTITSFIQTSSAFALKHTENNRVTIGECITMCHLEYLKLLSYQYSRFANSLLKHALLPEPMDDFVLTSEHNIKNKKVVPSQIASTIIGHVASVKQVSPDSVRNALKNKLCNAGNPSLKKGGKRHASVSPKSSHIKKKAGMLSSDNEDDETVPSAAGKKNIPSHDNNPQDLEVEDGSDNAWVTSEVLDETSKDCSEYD